MPNEFLCPITRVVMKDPVVASDGHTYEQEAINKWFENNNTSPLTGAMVHSKNLVKNHALRSAIENWLTPPAQPAAAAPAQEGDDDDDDADKVLLCSAIRLRRLTLLFASGRSVPASRDH